MVCLNLAPGDVVELVIVQRLVPLHSPERVCAAHPRDGGRRRQWLRRLPRVV